jgi:hypothetical protein
MLHGFMQNHVGPKNMSKKKTSKTGVRQCSMGVFSFSRIFEGGGGEEK